MIKKKALWKDIWQEIRYNKARFFALLAIVTLGVGFYAGISATGPDMIDTAHTYYEEQNLFDLKVLSTYGIQQEDIAALDDVKSISIEPIQTVDVSMLDEEFLIRVFPRSEKDHPINDYEVVSGRLPEKDDELALDAAALFQERFAIGDDIQFQIDPEKSDEAINLNDQIYTIVGFVNSPLYIEKISRGSTQVGKGSIDGFAVVADSALTGDVYTEMYVQFDKAADYESYSPEYKDFILEKTKEIEVQLNGRPLERINEIRAEGRKEIFDGEKELAEARQLIADAEQELANARQELDEGIATYQANEAEFETEIANAEQTLAEQQAVINQGMADYQAGLRSWEENTRLYANEKTAWEIQRPGLLQQMDGAITLESLAENPIPTAEGESLAAEIQYLLDGEADIERARSQIENHAKTITAQEELLALAAEELNIAKANEQTLESEIIADQAAIPSRKEALEAHQMQTSTIEGFLAEGPFEELTDERIAQMLATVTEQGHATQIYSAFIGYLAGEQSAESVKDLVKVEYIVQEQMTKGIAEAEAALVQKQTTYATEAERIVAEERRIIEEDQMLETAKQSYGTTVRNIENSAAELQRAKNILQNENQIALQGIQQQVTAVDQQFREQAAALESARVELETARSDLEVGQSQLNQARNELATERQAGEEALAEAWQEIQTGEETYNISLAEFEEERMDAVEEIQKGETELEKASSDLRRLEEPVYFVQNRSVNPGYEGYGDNANRISAIAAIFPVFFFLIAALISFTTMTRMVDEQRQQMGTLKGLGYSDGDIALKFFVYAAIAGLGGTVIGLLSGYQLFPSIIYNAYSSLYNLPDITINYYLSYAFIALLVALLCTIGPALIASYRSLQEKPASLMRPKAPKIGKRVLLERVPFIWNRLNFNAKITIRNLVRYKTRNSMTVIGVAGCMALILTGFAVKNSISGLAETQFNEIMSYDAIVTLQSAPTFEEKREYEEILDSHSEITNYLYVLQEAYRVEKAGMSTQDVTVFVPEDPNQLADFVTLQERDVDIEHQLTDEGAILTEKLANLLEVTVGDEVVLVDDEEMTYKVPIQAITENYTGHYLYITRNHYETIFAKTAVPNSSLLRYEADSAWESNFAEQVMALDPVALVTYMETIDRAFADTLESLDIITLVLIISAAALAFVVLYNLTNVNVSERIRELSTIKVLGFYNNEVSMYIYRETLILTVIGIVFGFALGNVLATVLLKMVEVDFMLFPITILFSSYILSTFLTLLFSIIVMLIMHHKLKRIDMLEALQSVE